jgi:hypothetical protein
MGIEAVLVRPGDGVSAVIMISSVAYVKSSTLKHPLGGPSGVNFKMIGLAMGIGVSSFRSVTNWAVNLSTSNTVLTLEF